MSDSAFTNSGLYKLLLTGRQLKVRKNQIFQSTDHREALTLLTKGYVKRYSITNAGNSSIQSIYGPGDVFPLTWVFKKLLDQDLYEGQETFYYETMTDSEVCTIHDDVLIDMVNKNPQIYKDLLYVAGVRLRSNIHNLENISLQTIEKRLAHQLVYYAKYHGLKTTAGVKILIPLKQKELGSMLDATRETVSINLKPLRDKGLIKTGTFIIVTDIKSLEEFAYS